MALILTITNKPFTDANLKSSCRFESGGGIGRSEKCAWVLHDSSRYISGKHAAISLRGGLFYIMDTSTNGLYVNNKLVGKGNSAQINHGDELRIGQYEIKATIDVSTQAPHSPSLRPDMKIEPALGPAVSNDLSLMDILENKQAPSMGTDKQSPGLKPAGKDDLSLIPKGQDYIAPKPAASSTDRSHVLEQHFTPPVIPDDWYFSDNPPAKDIPPQSTDAKVRAGGTATPPPRTPKAGNPETVMQPQLSSGSNQEIVQALLDGMGIPSQSLESIESAEFAHTIGQVLRSTIEGIVTILRARTAFKSEFRMEMTTIKSLKNNPLKFSVGTDEVLRHLFFNRANSYLPPLQSVQEGFQDIQAHQIAMMAGMQAALKDILGLFEPGKLEKQFEQNESSKKLMPGNKKSRNWDAYSDHYQQLLQHIQDDFHAYFGKKFTAIYEQQVAKLKEAGKISN